MAEQMSSPMFQVGRNVAPSDLPASQRMIQPHNVAQEWERVLWTKTAPTLQRVVEEARPFGRRERTPAAVKWLRVLWARRWSQRRAERMHNTIIHEGRAHVQTFMTMAQYAINLAIKTEPIPEVRSAKRRELMSRWRNAYTRMLGGFNR